MVTSNDKIMVKHYLDAGMMTKNELASFRWQTHNLKPRRH